MRVRGSWLVMGVIAFSLSACSATFRNHGYAPSDGELAEVLVGVDTRDSVLSLVGRPGAAGVVDEGGLYYISSRFRNYAYQAPQEVDRQVVAITFDEADVVANVERFTLEDGQVVPISRRVTDSEVQRISFLRQLLGNIGAIDTGSLFGGGSDS